jgi:hypothetical protein
MGYLPRSSLPFIHIYIYGDGGERRRGRASVEPEPYLFERKHFCEKKCQFNHQTYKVYKVTGT